ncbi:hypothetical protein V8D89_013672 [Ganoderma adspersum]
MSSPLLFGLVSLAAFSIRLARAQFSNITCTSQHAWMSNSRGQNPCLVAAYLSVPCAGETAAVDEPLDDSGEYYDGPLFGPDNCSCNTVMYSVVEACQLCQFDVGGGPQAWSAWSRNCTTTTVGSYPMGIQPGTAVPAWAYLDVVKADRFNETAARLVAAANAPESTAVSSSSSASTTITATFSTDSATSQSAVTNTTSSQLTATGVGAAVGSNSNHSDSKGPLVGGVVGGVLGLLLIAALVFYILLRHRRLTGAAHTQPDSGNSALSIEGTISRSGTPGPYGHPVALKERMMSPTDSVVYDPDDPRTFPPQMGMATMGGSVDGHMRETTVASEGYASSLGYRPTAMGSIYRGAPEMSL